jgi:hypothetical protein
MSTSSTDYIVNGNEVFRSKDTEYVRLWEKCSVPQGDPEPMWLKPKIPYALWQQARGFCLWTQAEFKSEGMVLFFFDEVKGWAVWAPPQITAGMTVETNADCKEYKEQRALLPELMLGSLHHHCTSKAFSSGVDKADEMHKDGIHFTLGKLDESMLDIHARFVFKKTEHVVNYLNWVEPPEWINAIPYHTMKYNNFADVLKVAECNRFPEEWKANISKKVYTSTTWNKNTSGYAGGYGHNNYGTTNFPIDSSHAQQVELPNMTDLVADTYEDPAWDAENIAEDLEISVYELALLMNPAEMLDPEDVVKKACIPDLLKTYEISDDELMASVTAAIGYDMRELA